MFIFGVVPTLPFRKYCSIPTKNSSGSALHDLHSVTMHTYFVQGVFSVICEQIFLNYWKLLEPHIGLCALVARSLGLQSKGGYHMRWYNIPFAFPELLPRVKARHLTKRGSQLLRVNTRRHKDGGNSGTGRPRHIVVQ